MKTRLALIATAGVALSLLAARDAGADDYAASADDPATNHDLTRHPGPQPRLAGSNQCADYDAGYTLVETDTTFLPEPTLDPITQPPGTNLLANVYTNMYDGNGVEMANTLPSTPTIPYNLHPDPEVSHINPISPTDDLIWIVDLAGHLHEQGETEDRDALLDLAIAILEGGDLDPYLPVLLEHADYLGNTAYLGYDEYDEGTTMEQAVAYLGQPRAYEGIPLLHIAAAWKKKDVECEEVDGEMKCNVDVHQIWYGQRIEADTAYIDPSAAIEHGVPWTMTYTVDVLNRGGDDFSPFVMYTDDPAISDPDFDPSDPSTYPGKGRLPHIGMDQTFFPIDDGTRTVFELGMAEAKYFNLNYTWGWRIHPPRIQVVENSLKRFPGGGAAPAPPAGAPESCASSATPTMSNGQPLTFGGQPVDPSAAPDLVQWEEEAFGPVLEQTATWQEYVAKYPDDIDARIAQIGDIAPAKRMWRAFNQARSGRGVPAALDRANEALLDWRDRTRLPRYESGGELVRIRPDAETDMTLLYVNNTIYGEFSNETPNPFPEVRFPDWRLRGQDYAVTLVNGDHFVHAYASVDFGGARGWENQFKSSTKVGGSGCWFTFGRAHWMPNHKPLLLAPAEPGRSAKYTDLSPHRLTITFNYEPSTRLRFYQYDPIHHDVAVFSIH